MISLNLQLKMIVFSFLYGFIFCFLLKLIKLLIYDKKYFIHVILFGILNGLLYFVLLKRINDGILNINLLFLFIFGVLMCKGILEKM